MHARSLAWAAALAAGAGLCDVAQNVWVACCFPVGKLAGALHKEVRGNPVCGAEFFRDCCSGSAPRSFTGFDPVDFGNGLDLTCHYVDESWQAVKMRMVGIEDLAGIGMRMDEPTIAECPVGMLSIVIMQAYQRWEQTPVKEWVHQQPFRMVVLAWLDMAKTPSIHLTDLVASGWPLFAGLNQLASAVDGMREELRTTDHWENMCDVSDTRSWAEERRLFLSRLANGLIRGDVLPFHLMWSVLRLPDRPADPPEVPFNESVGGDTSALLPRAETDEGYMADNFVPWVTAALAGAQTLLSAWVETWPAGQPAAAEDPRGRAWRAAGLALLASVDELIFSANAPPLERLLASRWGAPLFMLLDRMMRLPAITMPVDRLLTHYLYPLFGPLAPPRPPVAIPQWPPTSDLVMGVLTTNQETVSDFIRGRRMPFCKVPAFVRAIEDVAARGAGAGDARLRVVEVGANLGDCVLWGAAYARAQGLPVSALAYEPHDPSAQRIGWTARVNSLDVKPRSVGIVAEPSNRTMHLFVPDHRTAESGFHKHPGAEGFDFFSLGTVEVPVTTLDEDVMNVWPWTGDQVPVDLLKMNTNGDEVAVFNSASGLLSRGAVCAVMATVYRLTIRKVVEDVSFETDQGKVEKMASLIAALDPKWKFGYYRPTQEEYTHPPGAAPLDAAAPRGRWTLLNAGTVKDLRPSDTFLGVGHGVPGCSSRTMMKHLSGLLSEGRT